MQQQASFNLASNEYPTIDFSAEDTYGDSPDEQRSHLFPEEVDLTEEQSDMEGQEQVFPLYHVEPEDSLFIPQEAEAIFNQQMIMLQNLVHSSKENVISQFYNAYPDQTEEEAHRYFVLYSQTVLTKGEIDTVGKIAEMLDDTHPEKGNLLRTVEINQNLFDTYQRSLYGSDSFNASNEHQEDPNVENFTMNIAYNDEHEEAQEEDEELVEDMALSSLKFRAQNDLKSSRTFVPPEIHRKNIDLSSDEGLLDLEPTSYHQPEWISSLSQDHDNSHDDNGHDIHHVEGLAKGNYNDMYDDMIPSNPFIEDDTMLSNGRPQNIAFPSMNAHLSDSDDKNDSDSGSHHDNGKHDHDDDDDDHAVQVQSNAFESTYFSQKQRVTFQHLHSDQDSEQDSFDLHLPTLPSQLQSLSPSQSPSPSQKIHEYHGDGHLFSVNTDLDRQLSSDSVDSQASSSTSKTFETHGDDDMDGVETHKKAGDERYHEERDFIFTNEDTDTDIDIESDLEANIDREEDTDTKIHKADHYHDYEDDNDNDNDDNDDDDDDDDVDDDDDNYDNNYEYNYPKENMNKNKDNTKTVSYFETNRTDFTVQHSFPSSVHENEAKRASLDKAKTTKTNPHKQSSRKTTSTRLDSKNDISFIYPSDLTESDQELSSKSSFDESWNPPLPDLGQKKKDRQHATNATNATKVNAYQEEYKVQKSPRSAHRSAKTRAKTLIETDNDSDMDMDTESGNGTKTETETETETETDSDVGVNSDSIGDLDYRKQATLSKQKTDKKEAKTVKLEKKAKKSKIDQFEQRMLDSIDGARMISPYTPGNRSILPSHLRSSYDGIDEDHPIQIQSHDISKLRHKTRQRTYDEIFADSDDDNDNDYGNNGNNEYGVEKRILNHQSLHRKSNSALKTTSSPSLVDDLIIPDTLDLSWQQTQMAIKKNNLQNLIKSAYDSLRLESSTSKSSVSRHHSRSYKDDNDKNDKNDDESEHDDEHDDDYDANAMLHLKNPHNVPFDMEFSPHERTENGNGENKRGRQDFRQALDEYDLHNAFSEMGLTVKVKPNTGLSGNSTSTSIKTNLTQNLTTNAPMYHSTTHSEEETWTSSTSSLHNGSATATAAKTTKTTKVRPHQTHVHVPVHAPVHIPVPTPAHTHGPRHDNIVRKKQSLAYEILYDNDISRDDESEYNGHGNEDEDEDEFSNREHVRVPHRGFLPPHLVKRIERNQQDAKKRTEILQDIRQTQPKTRSAWKTRYIPPPVSGLRSSKSSSFESSLRRTDHVGPQRMVFTQHGRDVNQLLDHQTLRRVSEETKVQRKGMVNVSLAPLTNGFMDVSFDAAYLDQLKESAEEYPSSADYFNGLIDEYIHSLEQKAKLKYVANREAQAKNVHTRLRDVQKHHFSMKDRAFESDIQQRLNQDYGREMAARELEERERYLQHMHGRKLNRQKLESQAQLSAISHGNRPRTHTRSLPNDEEYAERYMSHQFDARGQNRSHHTTLPSRSFEAFDAEQSRSSTYELPRHTRGRGQGQGRPENLTLDRFQARDDIYSSSMKSTVRSGSVRNGNVTGGARGYETDPVRLHKQYNAIWSQTPQVRSHYKN